MNSRCFASVCRAESGLGQQKLRCMNDTLPEPAFAEGKVVAPHSDEFFTESQAADLRKPANETFVPCLQGQGIIQRDVFQVYQLHIGVISNMPTNRGIAGQLAAWKDVTLDEVGVLQ